MSVNVTDKMSEQLITNLVQRLALIRLNMVEKGDHTSGEKIWQLLNKVKNREFSFAFCGHFSAGKSSMINELWEEELLPSSPIPTSANLVKVKAGEPWARVYFKQKSPIQFSYPYDIRKVKAYCLDGDEVEAVEISHPSSRFPSGIVVFDTPGIDSTDDAHRVATMSSLHLADVVFYVMDYNHVQSEINFHFAKQIQELGKQLYFVINQIDKHDEKELPFAQYQEAVRTAFRNWNIQPAGIFYTSLLKQVKENELDDLKRCIQQLIENREQFFLENVKSAAKSIIDEHLEWLKSEHEEKRLKIQETLRKVDVRTVKDDYEQALTRKNDLEYLLKTLEQDLKQEVEKILKNAILMPFETRELARKYLESMDEKFKVGFLFSKQKTAQERKVRLQAFYEKFMENVQSQLDWHVKQLLVDKAKQHDINDSSFLTMIFDSTIEIPIAILKENMKPGATLNGDYLLNYTDDVAEAAKKPYRQFAYRVIAELVEKLAAFAQDELRALKDKLCQLEQAMHALQAEKELQHEETHAYETLVNLLNTETNVPQELLQQALGALPTEQEITLVNDREIEAAKALIETAETEEKAAGEEKREHREAHNVDELISRLQKIAEEIKEVKGFQSAAKELSERALRLKSRKFTVALFGAFSAGKSSFANAFIGEALLPVSPNPTTATINKIVPVDENHPHGTVVVKMKSEEDLLSDIRMSLKYVNEDVDSLDAVHEKIAKIKASQLDPKAKPHYAFLQAVEKGISFYRKHAGKLVTIPLDEFQAFVAQEEKACFVEWIELYYDCPLTREGITLVDTPGADSINARHTNVAFDYIKNADAILFVTYYNHAFSQADKDFLTQLGRVKDIFELDKMFFIVNASDLAKSDEELELVVKHVEQNLLQHQIKNPRIFPLSSQVALLSKLGQQNRISEEQFARLAQLLDESREREELFDYGLSFSKFPSFEETFYQFIHGELMNAAVNAGTNEIAKTKDMLYDWLKSAQQNDEIRLKQKEETERLYNELATRVHEWDVRSEKQALLQEIEELFYYVKQRFVYGFKDRYQQSFNPAVLQKDARSMKNKLEQSADDLVELVEFDLAQEMRATSLRIETFLRKQLDALYNRIAKMIHEQTTTTFLGEFEFGQIDTPQFLEQLTTLQVQSLYKHLSVFKNPKQFFEQNGQEELKERLLQALDEPVDNYLEENLQSFQRFYEEMFMKGCDFMTGQLNREMKDYFDGKLAVLSADVDVAELKRVYEKVKDI